MNLVSTYIEVMRYVWLVYKVNRFLERANIWTATINESSFRHNKNFKSYSTCYLTSIEQLLFLSQCYPVRKRLTTDIKRHTF